MPLEEIIHDSEEEIDISFIEGGQMIKMAVQAEEEQEFMDEQEEAVDSSDSDEGPDSQINQLGEQNGHSAPKDERSEGEIVECDGQNKMDEERRADLSGRSAVQPR